MAMLQQFCDIFIGHDIVNKRTDDKTSPVFRKQRQIICKLEQIYKMVNGLFFVPSGKEILPEFIRLLFTDQFLP